MHFISLHRFFSSDFQVPAPHPSSGRHLTTPTALPLSAVQGATGHPADYTQGLWASQHMFLQFCHYYGLLPVPDDQETLLHFATFLADAKGLQHGTIHGYLYGVRVLYIDMGLSNPLKGTFWLYKGLQTIHIINVSSLTQHLASCLHIWTAGTHPTPTQILYTMCLMGCPDHGSLWFPLDGQIHGRSGNLWPSMALVCPGCYTSPHCPRRASIHYRSS